MTIINTARVDQLVAAALHGQAIAPRENRWLVDPEAGDPWTTMGLLIAATGRFYYADKEKVAPEASPRTLTVNGNAPWADADDIESDDEDTLAQLGLDECKRCITHPTPTVSNVLHVAAGKTVVEFSYCDDCANHLDSLFTGLVWKVRSARAAV